MDDINTSAGDIGDRLRAASADLEVRLARVLAPRGVTVAEWRLLRALLATGPTSPSLLATRMDVTRGAVTRLIARLRATALIGQAGAGGDARYRLVALTGVGRRLTPELTILARREEHRWTARLTKSDHAALMRLLDTLGAPPSDSPRKRCDAM